MNKMLKNKKLPSFQGESSVAQLFAFDIGDFSSQYGKEGSKSYTVLNVRGGPNHFPQYGDFLESCVLVSNETNF